MRRTILIPSLLAGLACLLAAGAAHAQCTGVNHVTWPAVDPVWDFCWQRPSISALANGEGIRITNVQYQGVTILKTAHTPVLNVEYNAGGCGGGGLCYRDWFDQERSFTCAPGSSGYCPGTTTAAETVCGHPGTDAGSFSGVAVEDKGTHLRLTSQCQAGWYRYISTWEFYPDGTMKPGMDLTAVNNSCVAHTHRHHAYFRLDFDVDGAAGDFVTVTGGGPGHVATEQKWSDTSGTRTEWVVGSAGSSTTVSVARNAGDGYATGDPFARGDGWLLAYSASQEDDGPHGLSQCPVDLDNYVNAQDVDEADIVLWVHAMNTHIGEPGGQAHSCSLFGPTLKVNMTDDLIFQDGVDSGDLTAWDSSLTDTGDLQVTAAAALQGPFGLAARLDDENDLYAEDGTPDDLSRYRARFYLDPNSIATPEGKRTKVFQAFSATNRRLITTTLRRVGGAYQLLVKAHLDNDLWAKTLQLPLPDASTAVELDWIRSAGTNNGLLRVWINGTMLADLPGLDNDLSTVDYVRLGAISPPAATGPNDTFYLDSFVSRKSNYIGP